MSNAIKYKCLLWAMGVYYIIEEFELNRIL